VRVEAGTNDVDLHRAARNGRGSAWGDEFCAAHRLYDTAVPFYGLRNRSKTVC
jgi:hypothetical protein